jgi:hypothetical protein
MLVIEAFVSDCSSYRACEYRAVVVCCAASVILAGARLVI